jgi:adenine-specific DNA-methyltransferase
MPDLFADFNGLSDLEAKTEFYQHDQNWSNRMILGDSLQVMASLAEREGLRGKVQCIYFDPPYGIRFNSNWQVSTLSRDVDDVRIDLTREPEQVKAFRDTWKDGIHSYLTYLRDRLTVARELLSETGSIFVQISDENAHRIRGLLDEVFGERCYINTIVFKKKSATYVTQTVFDEIIWYSRSPDGVLKVRELFECREQPEVESKFNTIMMPGMLPISVSKLSENKIKDLVHKGGKWARVDYPIVSQHPSDTRSGDYVFRGTSKTCGQNKQWRFSPDVGLPRLEKSGRLFDGGGRSLGGVSLWDDWNQVARPNIWSDVHGEKYPTYVVQTALTPIQRCILMTTDPGDLVLDPTCGSGTTATVAEQWGRRWITIDTSRVALALARTRLMAAKYPYYLLADSREGRAKEQEVSGKIQPDMPTHNDVRHGFVYVRVPHVKLKSIADNAEIDVIWEEAQATLEPLRARLNAALGQGWEEWQIPREADPAWPQAARDAHAAWWEARIARQRRIDASIARRAETEYLYDRPYEDRSRLRVAGPFTVESLSPHRVVPADEDELLGHPSPDRRRGKPPAVDFATMVLDNLRTAGVHQSRKADSIRFTSLVPWPGTYIGAEGRFLEGETERRAAILIGPEFGTLSRPDLVAAAREAAEARFDVLIACAFNYDAHASELTRLGPLPILKARMNPDLHMADDLKNTGKGNLFVIFGEPDVVMEPVEGQPDHLRIRILGVDVFDPQTGDIRSGDTKSIAAWFIDTDYNEESFYVRHAYFLGASDPYKSLKAALRAEIDEDAWSTLYRDTSRPFPRPEHGRIAVKVINHFGDEVMKVFTV